MFPLHRREKSQSESTGIKIMLQLQWKRQRSLFKERKGRTHWGGNKFELVHGDTLPNNISAARLKTCKTSLWFHLMQRCPSEMLPSIFALFLDGGATLQPSLAEAFISSVTYWYLLRDFYLFFSFSPSQCLWNVFLPCSHTFQYWFKSSWSCTIFQKLLAYDYLDSCLFWHFQLSPKYRMVLWRLCFYALS